MRPIDKGQQPEEGYSKYQDAKVFLKERVGAYCSFCELPIDHVPEVEHREAKALGGELLAWENLLLSCKYCNTRKGTQVAAGQKGLYLWPDEDDTFHTYTYEEGIPGKNQNFLRVKGADYERRATKLFNLLQLDHIPTPRDRDCRWYKRMEAYNYAKESLEDWKKIKDKEDEELFLRQTLRVAKSTGFFSVWMEVFKEHKEIQKRLITQFKGTNKIYFEDILKG